MKDIRVICGNAIINSDSMSSDIIICSRESPEFLMLSGGKIHFSHSEEFAYKITEQKILFFGADDLGVIWGIYTFSERELSISPSYFFDGNCPERRSFIRVEEKTVIDYPRTRFRGWFVNDEDLLSGYRHKGKRKINYVFYKKIIAPNLMEKIAETAMRYRMNLLIPSTLIDIENPDEAALLNIVAKYGLYISQHHIEPLGVSHFALHNYMKNNGYDAGNISFVTNRKGKEAAWRYYVKKWAKYKRVVWQLGLRGNSDLPVWVSDKQVGKTDEERGKLISDAIFAQYDIIRKEMKGDIYTSMTVWMESSSLLEKGMLKLPDDTIIVFSDIGASQMYGVRFLFHPASWEKPLWRLLSYCILECRAASS